MVARRYIVMLLLMFQMAGWAQRSLLNEADVQVVSVLTDTGKIHATINYAKREVRAKHQDRFYYSFGGNKIRAMEAGINGIPLHGEYKAFFADKSIRTKGYFKKGLKHGTWKTWNQAGELISVCKWRKGIRSKKCLEKTTKTDSVKNNNVVDKTDTTAVENRKNRSKKSAKKKTTVKEKKGRKKEKKDKAEKIQKVDEEKSTEPMKEENLKSQKGKKKLPKKSWRKRIFKKNQSCPEIEKGSD